MTRYSVRRNEKTGEYWVYDHHAQNVCFGMKAQNYAHAATLSDSMNRLYQNFLDMKEELSHAKT